MKKFIVLFVVLLVFSFFSIRRTYAISIYTSSSNTPESMGYVQTCTGCPASFSTCYNDESVGVNHCGPAGCTGGSAWSRYDFSTCYIDPVLGGCVVTDYSYSSVTYSTGDKCIVSDGPYLRPGYCDGSYGAYTYKVCCNNSGGGVYSGTCEELNYDNQPPPEGDCPAGSYEVQGDASSCGTPAPGAPQSTGIDAFCSTPTASITFSFVGGSGATYNEVQYAADSSSFNQTVELPSSPYTIEGFTPGHRIYYNYYACNSGGCTPDPRGNYFKDLPATCAGPTATPTPIPTVGPTPTSYQTCIPYSVISTTCGTTPC